MIKNASDRIISAQHPTIQQQWQHRLMTWYELRRLLRFTVTGGLNTAVDLLLFNLLLWLHPTTDQTWIVVANSLAFGCGALNSYLLNKFWTFRSAQRIIFADLWRFAALTVAGILVTDALWWGGVTLFGLFITQTVILSNVIKVATLVIWSGCSYAGMRFWVFVFTHQIHQPDPNVVVMSACPGNPLNRVTVIH